MLKIALLVIVLQIFSTNQVSSVNITATNGTITCPPDADECIIDCAGFEACSSDTNLGIGDGPEIHCPTGDNCETCQLQCQGRAACAGRTIYGYNCSLLEIDVQNTRAAQRLTVFAPQNNGILLYNAITGRNNSVGTQIYTTSSINRTGQITVNCIEESSNPSLTGGCRNILIDARYALYSQLNCVNNGDCNSINYHCPLTSSTEYYQTFGTPGCQLNCTDSRDCTVDAYINDNDDSYEDDIEIICEGDYCSDGLNFTDIQIYYGSNNTAYCDYMKNMSAADDWYCRPSENNSFNTTTTIATTTNGMITTITPGSTNSLTTSSNTINSGASTNTNTNILSSVSYSTTMTTTDGNVFERANQSLSPIETIAEAVLVPYIIIPVIMICFCCCVGGTQNIYFNICNPEKSDKPGSKPQLVNEQSKDIVIFE